MARSAVVRSGLTRILTVVGVVAGVLAMHGLTSNHDAAMPGMAAAQTDSSRPAGTGDPTMTTGHASAVDSGVHLTTAASAGSTTEKPQARDTDAGHGMAGACVAVLTLSLLLLALALRSRWRLIWRTVPRDPRPAQRPVPAGRPAPWLAPSLSKLCVLRT
ncbi:DUF6153 family protein [Kribbella qitaiheensis]|uniref:DUF6153 family protein n=1 Tax=Kribbella qitaiheensis TaxID=1544730 RepID=UPI003D188379